MSYDIAIVGAGPAGSTCAALCAQAGWRTILIEKSVFPRDKVCGDCLNPACWPILDRLGVSDRVRALSHSRLEAVEFNGIGGPTVRFPLPADPRGEIAIKRSALDELLMLRAMEAGAEVLQGAALTQLEEGWRLQAGERAISAKFLVAADGRNSTVARLRKLLPTVGKERVGLQTHVPAPADFGEKVAMHLLPDGYCGVASIGEGQLNVCLVAPPAKLPELKRWAAERFAIAPEQTWRTITPLARAPLPPRLDNLLLVGDAARVVEPFTGEGIYYALASGALAADCLLRDELAEYPARHRALYRGRLWINRLAKAAVLHPRISTQALRLAQRWPAALHFLTARVIHTAGVSS
ncbi:MAG: Geranylgeranyl reductase [Chthoniobacter sp.]|nr:Geranylgeranyl reductase [Chthoniobacter sp.]